MLNRDKDSRKDKDKIDSFRKDVKKELDDKDKKDFKKETDEKERKDKHVDDKDVKPSKDDN